RLAGTGAALVATDGNPLDAVWSGRPDAPLAPVRLRDAGLAGEATPARLARVATTLAKARADAVLLTQPDSIAWAFNLRGGDIPHVPVALAFALVPADGRPTLFVDARKLSNAVRADLASIAEIAEPAGLAPALAALGTA